ncbi:MAG: hypothetical protein ABI539_15920, partial [Acidobacteriota bacterium]
RGWAVMLITPLLTRGLLHKRGLLQTREVVHCRDPSRGSTMIADRGLQIRRCLCPCHSGSV